MERGVVRRWPPGLPHAGPTPHCGACSHDPSDDREFELGELRPHPRTARHTQRGTLRDDRLPISGRQ